MGNAMLTIRQNPSPNQGPRPDGVPIDMLILHYTDTVDTDAALNILLDPARKVSAHYLVAEDGTIHSLVPERRRAWHAGVSAWGGATDINDRSIGIEIVNPGHSNGYRAFPEAQMLALMALIKEIMQRHQIPPIRVLAHSDVAPQRKKDPGELFDWPRLAADGLAVWPLNVKQRIHLSSLQEIQAKLAKFGYAVPQGGVLDEETRQVITAFQRHFRPRLLSGIPDEESEAILDALLAPL